MDTYKIEDKIYDGIGPNPRADVANAFGSDFRGSQFLLLGVAKTFASSTCMRLQFRLTSVRSEYSENEGGAWL